MARTTEEVDLIVKMVTEGVLKGMNQLDNVEDAIEDVADSADDAGNRFTELKAKLDLAKEGFNQLKQAAQFAIETIERGAAIEATTKTFDNLATSIGETGDALRNDLRSATGNMVADMELMASANRFMAMGLASTTDEVSELSAVAVNLGAAMGVGPAQAMEDFALLLANQSIPRLDTFGISSGKVRERIAELTTGVNALDKETAFMMATMEQAELTMDKTGSAMEGNAASIAQAKAEVQNLKDEFALLAVTLAGPVLHAYSEDRKAVRLLDEAIAAGVITREEYNEMGVESGGIFGDEAAIIEEVADRMEEYNERQAENVAIQEESNRRTEEYNNLLAQNAADAQAASDANSMYVASIAEYIEESEAQIAMQAANNEALEVSAEHYESLTSFVGSLDGTAAQASETMLNLAQSITDSALATEVMAGNITPLEATISSINSQEGLGLVTGSEADQMRDAAGEFENLNTIISDNATLFAEAGGVTVEQGQLMAEKIELIGTTSLTTEENMRIMAMQGGENMETLTSDFVDIRDEVDNAAISVGKLKDVIIDGLPSKKVIEIEIRQIGHIPEGLGTDITSDVMQQAGVN